MSRPRRVTRFAGILYPLILILILVGSWQVVISSGLMTFDTVPAPNDVFRELLRLGSSGELIAPLAHTSYIVMLGSLIALALGTGLGIALGVSSTVYNWAMASVDFLRSLPVVALLPVAVLLWGPSTKSELVLTAYAATWIIVVNTASAYRDLNPRLRDVAETFSLSKIDTMRKIWLPAIVPTVLVGMRLAVVSATITAVIAETLVNPQGLGWAIIAAQRALRPDQLWAYALLAGMLGYLLNAVLLFLGRQVSPLVRRESTDALV